MVRRVGWAVVVDDREVVVVDEFRDGSSAVVCCTTVPELVVTVEVTHDDDIRVKACNVGEKILVDELVRRAVVGCHE